MDSDQQAVLRLWPLPVRIKLSPGFTPGEALRFVLIATMMNAIVGFVATMQPLLIAQLADVQEGGVGKLVANLTLLQKSMVLIFVGFAGVLADRWGRKVMMMLALIGFAISCVIYPLVAVVPALFMVRGFFGLTQTGHTAGMPVKMLDYPDDASRGKFQGLIMFSFGLGSIVLAGLLWPSVPGWLRNAGLSPAEATRTAFWIVAATAALTAVLCAFGLKPDRKPPAEAETEGKKRRGVGAFFKGFAEVYRYALTRPTFALLMLMGFISRTDDTVLNAFLPQWVTMAGSTQGLDKFQAAQVIGRLNAVQAAALLIAPWVMGPLLDRANRMTVYCIAAVGSGVVLMGYGLIHNVTTWPIYALTTLVGLTEAALLISQNSLFGREAPAHLRGTAYGVFAFTGSATALIITYVSGYLFDKVGYTAPLVLSGALHLVLLGFGGVLLFRSFWKKRPGA